MLSINQFLTIILFVTVLTSCKQSSRSSASADAPSTTPLQKMISGNMRFAGLKPVHPDETQQRLKDAAKSQHPFAVIVTCSDSRVSPELIFDQGVGDLFVIRTAGNVIGPLELGSIEYAVEHLGVQLVVVMGHESCGAVKAFTENAEAPDHIKSIIDSLQQEAEIKAIPVNDANRLDDCVKANVLHGVKQLQTESSIIAEKLKKKEVQVVGMRYDLDDLKATVIE